MVEQEQLERISFDTFISCFSQFASYLEEERMHTAERDAAWLAERAEQKQTYLEYLQLLLSRVQRSPEFMQGLEDEQKQSLKDWLEYIHPLIYENMVRVNANMMVGRSVMDAIVEHQEQSKLTYDPNYKPTETASYMTVET